MMKLIVSMIGFSKMQLHIIHSEQTIILILFLL